MLRVKRKVVHLIKMHRKYKSDLYSAVTVFGNGVYSMKVPEARSNVLSKEQCQPASTPASPAWRKDRL